MRYTGHLWFGATAGLLTAVVHPAGLFTHMPFDVALPAFAVPLLFASLLPDIDEEHSFIGRKAPAVARVAHVVFLGHRGITHRVWFWGLLTALLFLLWTVSPFFQMYPEILIGFSVGYLSHLAADKISPRYISLSLSPYFSFILFAFVFAIAFHQQLSL